MLWRACVYESSEASAYSFGLATNANPTRTRGYPLNINPKPDPKPGSQTSILENSTVNVILGCPWLVQHNPIFSWKSGEILKWGESCFPDCFPQRPHPPNHNTKRLQMCTTSIESPLEKQSVDIPSGYAPFSDVFCPKRASKLPPHRPWDCAIDLLPGESVPRGKIYPLSNPEQKAMEEYIEEALQQGYICPSTSPAASSFFFVAKKDGGLQPCIDYQALNE